MLFRSAHPRGPVYLTLPREVLAQKITGFACATAPAAASAPYPDPGQVRELARALTAARFPVIACSASGADPATVPLLVELAERFGVGVVESRPKNMNFPSTHPLHLGQDLESLLPETDALLVLESDDIWQGFDLRQKDFAYKPISLLEAGVTDPARRTRNVGSAAHATLSSAKATARTIRRGMERLRLCPNSRPDSRPKIAKMRTSGGNRNRSVTLSHAVCPDPDLYRAPLHPLSHLVPIRAHRLHRRPRHSHRWRRN